MFPRCLDLNSRRLVWGPRSQFRCCSPAIRLQFLCEATKIPLLSHAGKIAFKPLIPDEFSRPISTLFGCWNAFFPAFRGIPDCSTLSPTLRSAPLRQIVRSAGIGDQRPEFQSGTPSTRKTSSSCGLIGRSRVSPVHTMDPARSRTSRNLKPVFRRAIVYVTRGATPMRQKPIKPRSLSCPRGPTFAFNMATC